jgi:hypothetical protein
MEVNTNLGSVGSSSPVTKNNSVSKPRASAPNETDSASLTSLDDAMQSSPASRPDAVQRARDLIANPNYPSSQVMSQVSDLLAGKLQSSQQS